MKKKIGIFALLLVMLPLLALVGCGTPDSFYVEAVSSWTGLPSGTRGGTVSGSGNYAEGKTVTLTATAKPESRFIAWVYEDTVLITDNSTYSIKNTGGAGEVSKSELSFKSSSRLKGKYTAIFDDNKIVYTMLTSWRVTNDITISGEDSATSTTPATMSANLFIAQGNISSDVYSAMNFEVKNNVINRTSNINEILKLNAEEPQELSVDLTLSDGISNFSKLMRAEIPFGTNTADFIPSSDSTYSYKVDYTTNGTYEIVFKFTFNGDDEYLVVEYSNLNEIF